MARPGLVHVQILRFTRRAMTRRWLCQVSSSDGGLGPAD
jgi:hypothetical protein